MLLSMVPCKLLGSLCVMYNNSMAWITRHLSSSEGINTSEHCQRLRPGVFQGEQDGVFGAFNICIQIADQR
jgi:hypothetical protein